MSLSWWRLLVDHIVDRAQHRLNLPIGIRRPVPPRHRICDVTRNTLIDDAAAAGWPILLLLRGDYEHFTVIERATPKRFWLLDSYGYHWISRDERDEAGRSPIAAASLTILTAS